MTVHLVDKLVCQNRTWWAAKVDGQMWYRSGKVANDNEIKEV